MLLIAFAANAQPPYEVLTKHTYSGTITKTIVRTFKEINIIGYVETTAGNFFFITDSSTSSRKEFQMPQDCYVTDFEVYKGNFVYLCGYYTGSTYGDLGILGYFSIHDVFNSIDHLYCYKT